MSWTQIRFYDELNSQEEEDISRQDQKIEDRFARFSHIMEDAMSDDWIINSLSRDMWLGFMGQPSLDNKDNKYTPYTGESFFEHRGNSMSMQLFKFLRLNVAHDNLPFAHICNRIFEILAKYNDAKLRKKGYNNRNCEDIKFRCFNKAVLRKHNHLFNASTSLSREIPSHTSTSQELYQRIPAKKQLMKTAMFTHLIGVRSTHSPTYIQKHLSPILSNIIRSYVTTDWNGGGCYEQILDTKRLMYEFGYDVMTLFNVMFRSYMAINVDDFSDRSKALSNMLYDDIFHVLDLDTIVYDYLQPEPLKFTMLTYNGFITHFILLMNFGATLNTQDLPGHRVVGVLYNSDLLCTFSDLDGTNHSMYNIHVYHGGRVYEKVVNRRRDANKQSVIYHMIETAISILAGVPVNVAILFFVLETVYMNPASHHIELPKYDEVKEDEDYPYIHVNTHLVNEADEYGCNVTKRLPHILRANFRFNSGVIKALNHVFYPIMTYGNAISRFHPTNLVDAKIPDDMISEAKALGLRMRSTSTTDSDWFMDEHFYYSKFNRYRTVRYMSAIEQIAAFFRLDTYSEFNDTKNVSSYFPLRAGIKITLD